MPADNNERASAEDPWIQDIIDDMHHALEENGREVDVSKLDQMLNDAIRQSTTESGSHLLDELKRRLSDMLLEHEDLRLGFEKRLHALWGNALDLLYMLIVTAREAGQDYNAALRPSAVERKDVVFEALVRLHGKACRVALEATHLLRSGFASGAHARWRTLHEVAVTSCFLLHQGYETAERYLHHWIIEASKDAEEYEKHYQKLGYSAPDSKDTARLRAHRAHLLDRFGEEYRHTHGWAAAALGVKKPTFADIEAAAGMDHYRPLYGLSNHWIHSGSRSLSFDLGLEPGQEFLLAGASNGGLAEPGHAVAISLVQVTAALLAWSPRTKDLVVLNAMVQLSDEIGEEFHRAHIEHQRRTQAALGAGLRGDEDDVQATE